MKKKLLLSIFSLTAGACSAQISFTHLSTYRDGGFEVSATEIIAYDPVSQRIFSTNGGSNSLDVIDFSNPSAISLEQSISMASYGAGLNSVAVKNQIIAVAVENANPQANGSVVFFDAATLAYLGQVTVGAMPDMVTFTPDGNKVLTANEGELYRPEKS
jgi:DNA-binding beta-propeller fold protein YncE